MIDFEKMKRGIQRRDFAVRCAACRSSGEDDKEEEPADGSGQSADSGDEQEEERSEEESADGSGQSADSGDEQEEKEEEESRSASIKRRGFIVEGYACTFGSPYQLWRGCGEAIFERMEVTALDGAEMRDVVLQYDHEGRVYARQSNGTLELSVDTRGLKVRADLSGTEEGRKLYEEIRGGYTTKMSLAFTIEDSDFEEKDEAEVLGFRTGSSDRYYLHTIRKIGRVYDVSAVSLPANEGTEIGVSSRQSSVGSHWGEASRDEARQRLALEIAFALAE